MRKRRGERKGKERRRVRGTEESEGDAAVVHKSSEEEAEGGGERAVAHHLQRAVHEVVEKLVLAHLQRERESERARESARETISEPATDRASDAASERIEPSRRSWRTRSALLSNHSTTNAHRSSFSSVIA